MNRKIVIVGTIAILGMGGYFIYKYYERQKIYDTPVTYEDALARLQKLKQ